MRRKAQNVGATCSNCLSLVVPFRDNTTVISRPEPCRGIATHAPSQHARGDLNFGRQRPMHGTFVGDFQKPRSLFVGDRSAQLNIALDSIEHSFFCFTFGAIDGVDFRVAQMNRDFLERPGFAPGVHPDRDRSTRPKRGQQKFVRRRPCVATSREHRLIGVKTMAARQNFLRVTGSAASDDYTFLFAASCRSSRSLDFFVHIRLHSQFRFTHTKRREPKEFVTRARRPGTIPRLRSAKRFVPPGGPMENQEKSQRAGIPLGTPAFLPSPNSDSGNGIRRSRGGAITNKEKRDVVRLVGPTRKFFD
jgi:hypothetical protein